MQRGELQLPPEAKFVGLARQVVRTAAQQAGMDEERISELSIAVSEAVTNAILALRRADSGAPVTLTYGVGEGVFEVVVTDRGPGFVPAADQAERELEQEGGLGVLVIRSLADEVEFEQIEGTQVKMRFAFHDPDMAERDDANGDVDLHSAR